MKISLYTDANQSIGFGHLHRCLAIADKLRDRGHTVSFDVLSMEAKAMVNDQSYKVVHDPTCDVLLADKYGLTQPELNERATKGTAIVVLNDHEDVSIKVDAVINPSLAAERSTYQALHASHYFLGSSYLLLKKEFATLAPKTYASNIRSILLTTGGSNPHHTLEKLSEVVHRVVPELQQHVIISNGAVAHTDVEKLQECSSITLFVGETNLAPRMREADVALSAAGGTLYELCATGTPTLVFSLADNQNKIATFADQQRLVTKTSLDEVQLEADLRKFLKQYESKESRVEQGKKMREGVKDGSDRIAHLIEEMGGEIR